MSFLSRDRETILGAGRWSICVRCGEGTHVNDDEQRHAPGCPLVLATPAPQVATSTGPTHEPCRDPHMYVWTARGIERLMDVEARQRGGR